VVPVQIQVFLNQVVQVVLLQHGWIVLLMQVEVVLVLMKMQEMVVLVVLAVEDYAMFLVVLVQLEQAEQVEMQANQGNLLMAHPPAPVVMVALTQVVAVEELPQNQPQFQVQQEVQDLLQLEY
jgi:hypothetical protein